VAPNFRSRNWQHDVGFYSQHLLEFGFLVHLSAYLYDAVKLVTKSDRAYNAFLFHATVVCGWKVKGQVLGHSNSFGFVNSLQRSADARWCISSVLMYCFVLLCWPHLAVSVIMGVNHGGRVWVSQNLEWLVSWSLTSPFSTNMAISETKGQGWRAIPTQWRKASNILTSTLAAFLFSSQPKGKGIERLVPTTGEDNYRTTQD